MHIGRSIDTARRRVIVRVPERVTGALVVKSVVELFRSRPPLASYDLIINLIRFDGDATNADILAIKAGYDPIPREPGLKYTVFVSLDPHFALWAETFDPQFDDRRHLVVQTQAEAEDFLDRARILDPATG